VGVYGCGPIGLLLVQLLRRAGAATVVATDLLAHRVAAAGVMGASEAFLVDAGPEPESSADRVAARERQVDVAFEVSGSDARWTTRSRRCGLAAEWYSSDPGTRPDELRGRRGAP